MEGSLKNGKKNFDFMDLVKFILSLFIVALHADALLDFSPLLNRFVCGGVARLAVPLFFLISAFFYFRKEQTAESVKRYCTRLGILYLCWFIVSFPKTIFDRFICSDKPFWETLFRFIRSFFVTSTFSGSWFLVSCAFCAILFYWLKKLPKRQEKTVTVVLSVIVYLFCVFTSAYGKLIEPLGLQKAYSVYLLFLANPYNNLFVGIPYFALGKYFAEHEVKNQKRNLLGFLFTLLLLFAEIALTSRFQLVKATDCYLMLLPCAWFLFPLIRDWNVELKQAKTLRAASTIIFFSHFLWLFAAEILEWLFKITIPYFGKFLFAVAGAFLTVFVILKLQNKKGFRWLRNFY